MTRRSRAREIVLQLLFQDEVNPPETAAATADFLSSRLQSEELIDFAKSLLAGVRRNRDELDVLLSETADWRDPKRLASSTASLMTTAFGVSV